MKRRFQNILSVVRREIELLSSDKNITIIVLVAPLFYAFFYSTIYFNKIETDIPVAVLDDDKTQTTEQLINNLNSHQLLEVYVESSNLNEAKKLLNNGTYLYH